ncbi:hypothetical protein POM88_044626 [Heracleum sosnowskyi]|uniref:Inhibitor I9 domain-containing protein n=1 Tax=Heracleum sosnowskyi TaxID=360622 RepID=A0AAD8M5H6_9APIA|nr:hypothetical protein POM88_044626 [Heracleum sosnowskyi]
MLVCLVQVLRTEHAKDAIFYSYTRHINGFAGTLDDGAAARIARHPNVVSVFLNKGRQLHTTRSWEFMGLKDDGVILPGSIWEKARFGEDAIIGNLDTDWFSSILITLELYKENAVCQALTSWSIYLVDNSTEKVIFAEAGKDFVDFLFGLLEIPLGSLPSLLAKERICESWTLSKVYESVNKLGNEYLQPDQTKKSLLNPDMPFSNTNTLWVTLCRLSTKPAPLMAIFSSPGPNPITPEILKPDISAPGVSIIAAYRPDDQLFDKKQVVFNAMLDTSMSCPHVSGIAGMPSSNMESCCNQICNDDNW